MKLALLIFYACVLGWSFTDQSMAQTKDPKKCNAAMKDGKYTWAGIAPQLKSPDSYFGYVLIKPKDVNRDYMVKLAKRLKAEYCQAEKFQVVIFDNKKYANSDSMRDYTLSKGKTILMRGFYSFDRSSGKDILEFSTKFGHPTTEVQIDLSKN
ncbi:MAG: hypothetical protein ACKVQW_11710 [Pyrinomonadaceae bacterium]